MTTTLEQSEQQWQDEQTRGIQQELVAGMRFIVPPRYRSARLEDGTPMADAVAAVIAGDTDGILVTGPTGVGKTHAAYAALRALAGGIRWRRTPRVEAISTPDLLARCRPGADPVVKRDDFGDASSHDPIDWYAKPGLLLLDDLGAEKPSEWTGEVLYRIIDSRYNYERTTIVVSNLPPGDLAKQIGDRLASRLTQMCRTVVIKGDDRRRQR